MVWLLAAALQLGSATLCTPPPKLGEVARIGQMGERSSWLYGVRKGKDLRMLTLVQCVVDDRPLADILSEADRMVGKGATDLLADRRLPERDGCHDSVGYIERNGEGGFRAVVYGRRAAVVASLRVDTDPPSDRARLIAIIEQFRTHLLGCVDFARR